MPDLFAVIPSTVFLAPLAVLAALFPSTFAGLAGGFKRWRAFLTVVSVNGLIAAVFFFLREYRWLPDSPFVSPFAVASYLLCVVFLGLIWAGRRYRRASVADPTITHPPTRKYIVTILAFAFGSALVVATVAFVAHWISTGSFFAVRFTELMRSLFDLPARELTVAVLGLFAAAGYLAYRKVTTPVEATQPIRLSLSGESVALGAMLVCGVTAVAVLSMPRAAAATISVESGDTALSLSPIRLTDASILHESTELTDVISGVTVSGDCAYFGGMKASGFGTTGAVVCVEIGTGKQRWVYTDAEMLTAYCTPTVTNGRVFCGEGLHSDQGCRLLCLDAATGQKVWEKRTTSHTEGTPVVADGRVYFSAGDDGVYCLTVGGAEVWHDPGRENRRHVDSSVTVANGRVYAGSGYQTLTAFALDAISGKEVWKTDLPLRSFGQPLVLGKRVYYGLGTGNLSFDLSTEPEPGRPAERIPAGAVVCLNTDTGELMWKRDLDRSVHTTMSADGRAVYAACRDGWVYALDRTTGAVLWRFSYGVPITTGTAVAAYTKLGLSAAVYGVSPSGGVFAHDPLSGHLIWSREIARMSNRDAEVMAPPTVVKADAEGIERHVYVPVTLSNRTTGQRRAAVARFVDRFAE